MIWGPLIAWYLFLAGTAAGAYLTASYIGFKHDDGQAMRKFGRFAAPVLLAVSLVMLMVDAEAGFKNPLRFLGLFANPGSVMTIGVYIICVFAPVSVAVAVMELLGRQVPRALDVVGDAAAVCLAGYTGFLLGVATGVPLWNNAALPALFLVSSASSGLALVSLAGALIDRKAHAGMPALRKYHGGLAVAELAILFMMLVIVASGSVAGSESVGSMVSGRHAPLFWVGVIGIGLVMPLLLEAALALRASRAPGADDAGDGGGGKVMTTAAEVVGNAGVMAGGFLLRYVVIAAAVMVALL